MRIASFLILGALCQVSVAGDPPNLADALSGKLTEPEYNNTPKYCLLVFGPQADTRVWLVEDGDTLYVDRNANGDLTDSDESVAASDVRDLRKYRDQKYKVGALLPTSEVKPNTELELTRYFSPRREEISYVIKLSVDGKIQHFSGWAPILVAKREDATIIHFGGRVVPEAVREKSLKLGEKRQHLHVRFGTPGRGEHSFASLNYETIPKESHPIARITWPAKPGTRAPVSRAFLEKRC